MTRHLSILGCGTMGRAIVGGLLASEPTQDSWTFGATTHSEESAARLTAELPVTAGLDNLAEARRGDVILLATKPQVAASVFAEPGMPDAVAGKLLISLCAGVTLAQLHGWAPGARVIRAMPNTPALIREGMTVLSAGVGVTPDDIALAKRMFTAVGRCRVLD